MSNRHRWLIGSLCVLYVAARVWRLGDSCLWFDEIFSVHAAEHDWAAMVRFVAQDLVHPPLFYGLLKVWIAWGGEGLIWLRLLPVLFSVLALVPFLCLCGELKIDQRSVLLALLLLAVNGSLIKYTQTLRMYSLLMFLSLVSLWMFARYFNRGKSWMWLVIVNVLLVYTHYFGWLVIGAEVFAILLLQRIKIARALSMAGIVLAAFVPWLIAVWNAARSGSDIGQNIAWQTRPGVREVATFLLDLTEPFYFQASNTEPGSIYLISVPLLLLGIVAIGIYLSGARSDNDKTRFRWLALFALFPAVIGFVISWAMPYSVWGTRHLIMVTPIVLTLAADAIIGLRERYFQIAAIAAILVTSLAALAVAAFRETPRYVWCAWDGVAADIQAKQPAATIYTFENLAAYHLWFASRSGAAEVNVVAGIDVLTADETYFLPRGLDEVKTVPIEQINEEEFWLAFRPVRRSDDARLIANFTRLGYTSCTRNEAEYGRNDVIWLKLAKDPKRCLAQPAGN